MEGFALFTELIAAVAPILVVHGASGEVESCN